MAWSMKARLTESCSCAMVCPCTLGPASPDQGWCSVLIGVHVIEGRSDDVDLSGAKLALGLELPGDFFGGIDKGKVYFDEAVSDKQRSELDGIFHGEKGGLWEGMRESFKEWLPSAVTSVEIEDGDSPKVTIKGVGQIVLEPIKGEDGTQATLQNAPVAAHFEETVLNLAIATGSGASDPDLRSWESQGYGATTEVEWSG